MNKKRGPYSSPRQQERRIRILRAAGDLFEEHGYSALSMQSIAEVSGVSTKTLYNLFGNLDSLLQAQALQRLDDLQDSAPVHDAEAGIPRLLAFTAGSMRLFENRPVPGRAVISILLRAELDPEMALERFGPVQRFAHASLAIAQEQGELREGLDLAAIANLFAASEWGVVLLWEKGLLDVSQLRHQISLNNYLTLIPLCVGERKTILENELEELLSSGETGFDEDKDGFPNLKVNNA